MATPLSSVIAISRELAHTDSNGLTDALGIDFANYAMMKWRKMLIQQGVDAAPLQETNAAVTDAVGTYLYPADMFLPKEIELNVWDTTSANANNLYYPVSKVTESDLPAGATVGWLRKNQSQQSPLVDFRGDFYEIFPTPVFTTWSGTAGGTLANAIRFFYYLIPVLYVATTDNLSYPESVDYFQFAKLIKSVFNYSLEKITFEEMEKEFALELKNFISLLKGGGKQTIAPKPISLTGFEF